MADLRVDPSRRPRVVPRLDPCLQGAESVGCLACRRRGTLDRTTATDAATTTTAAATSWAVRRRLRRDACGLPRGRFRLAGVRAAGGARRVPTDVFAGLLGLSGADRSVVSGEAALSWARG